MRNLLNSADSVRIEHYDKFFDDLGDMRTKSVLWYPSSGVLDLRPTVLFMDGEIKRINQSKNLNLKKVDLFLYNCLSPDEFTILLTKEGCVLFEDDKTRISCVQLIPTLINRDNFRYHISQDYYSGRVDLPSCPDSGLIKIRIESDTHGVQHSSLIFVHAENHNFFFEAILRHRIKVKYLVNVREGLAFGNCAKSFLETFIHQYLLSRNTVFRPEFFLRNPDFVSGKLRKCKDGTGYYLPMSGGFRAKMTLINQYNWSNYFGGLYADMYRVRYGI